MKIKLTFICLLFIVANLAPAQVKFRVKKLSADSLVSLIHEKQGAEKIEALNILSNVICRNNIDSSILLATQAIELSEKLDYKKGLADGYYNLGNGYFLHDSLQPTIANYLKACRFYEDLEPTIEYGYCCLQIALLNYFTRGPEKSPPYLDKAVKAIYSAGNKEEKYNINFVLTSSSKVVYPTKPDSIMYYGLKAISYIDTVVDHNELAFIYNDFGEGHLLVSDLPKALAWFTKALKLRHITDDLKTTLILNIARTHLAFNTEKHTSEAILYLQSAMEIQETRPGVVDQKPAIYQMLGSINYNKGEYTKAINYYRQGIQIAEDRLSDLVINEYPDPIHGNNYRYYIKAVRPLLYGGIYEAYLKLGKYDKALEHYILSKQKADEVYLEQNQNLITMLEAVSIDEKNKSHIELLASENELQKMQVRQSRTWMIVFGGSVVILVLLAILFVRQRRTRLFIREQKLLHDLELKEVESGKLKELDKMKSRFFANISHEFRTPLTLIMRPLEKVLSRIEDTDHRKDLDVAKKYAGKLQILINNLLTISKLESGKMQLRASKIEIVKLVNNYVQAFESLAKQKNITLSFITDRKEVDAFVDKEKFEQILNNLLSNAFRFTGEGGRIIVKVGCKKGQRDKETKGKSENVSSSPCHFVTLSVSDTGPGISPEHLPHIFDRFYQVEQENNNYFEGTGIGLALTKELVELHHGKIEVDSTPGKGSIFTIFLPLGKQHLKPEEIEKDISKETETKEFSHPAPETHEETTLIEENLKEENNKQPIMLIVEDNADMRIYIREHFESEYQIVEAVDGLDGFSKSTEHIPDVIISDVMMPKMDGNEFCGKLKNDERTSHIPLVLLTARASSESKIEGLETGADDFLTKPFDGEELKVRVKNLVEQRKRVRALLERKLRSGSSGIHIDFADSGMTSMDEQFLQKVISVLNEHHSNPELDVAAFGRHIGLSPAQLNRKIKALTGQSTGEFIRTYRLTRAAELLKKKSGTVAEIAYDVGFNNPSYFTECFKQHFGKLPSEFNGNT